MKRVITATYEDGTLKPSEELPLEDDQEVLVIIVPLSQRKQLSADEEAREVQMKQQAEAWLARQLADGVRPSLSLSESRTSNEEYPIFRTEPPLSALVPRLPPVQVGVASALPRYPGHP